MRPDQKMCSLIVDRQVHEWRKDEKALLENLCPVRAVLEQATMKMDEGPDKETEWRDEQKQLHFPRLRRHQRVQELTKDN